MRQPPTGRAILCWIGAMIVLLVTLLCIHFGAAHARDRGQFAQSSPEMHDWFEGLSSGKGPCCSDADGTRVSDPDWSNDDGRYHVRVDGDWYDVPPDAVVTVPNKAGFAMVWPLYYYVDGKPDHTRKPFGIRCFMPGSMT